MRQLSHADPKVLANGYDLAASDQAVIQQHVNGFAELPIKFDDGALFKRHEACNRHDGSAKANVEVDFYFTNEAERVTLPGRSSAVVRLFFEFGQVDGVNGNAVVFDVIGS
jgi:hypothetical protein